MMRFSDRLVELTLPGGLQTRVYPPFNGEIFKKQIGRVFMLRCLHMLSHGEMFLQMWTSVPCRCVFSVQSATEGAASVHT